MKKAFIPLGISGAFAVFGLVAAVALTGGLGGGGYTPEKYEIEGGNGIDSTANSPEELKSLMGDVVLQPSTYYDNLKNLDPSAPDPSPVEGKINSLGVVFEGRGTNYAGAYLDRTLTIAQNEKAAYYQAVGSEKYNGRTLDQDAILSVSRKGMSVKFNTYSVSYSSPASDEYEKMQRDMMDALIEGINDHRGEWYSVGLSEAHLKELETPVYPYETDKYPHYFALQLSLNYAEQFRSTFLSAIDSNNSFIGQMITVINSVTDFVSENFVYRGTYNDYDVVVDFTKPASPSFNYNDLQRGGDVSETATFVHVNNVFVPVAGDSAGDMFDLFGKPIEKYVKEQLKM